MPSVRYDLTTSTGPEPRAHHIYLPMRHHNCSHTDVIGGGPSATPRSASADAVYSTSAEAPVGSADSTGALRLFLRAARHLEDERIAVGRVILRNGRRRRDKTSTERSGVAPKPDQAAARSAATSHAYAAVDDREPENDG